MIDLSSDDVMATVSDMVGDLLIELHTTLASNGKTETVTVPVPALYLSGTNEARLRLGCDATLSITYWLGSWSGETETERLFIRGVLRRTAAVVP
jgi:hypothetical protein